jgi:hypothetical protein
MTILEAYQKLRLAVYATKFSVQVEFDNQEVYYFLLTDIWSFCHFQQLFSYCLIKLSTFFKVQIKAN